MKLVLFDIDKTLISGAKTHREAFIAGLKEIYGIDTDINIINTYGLTDKSVALEVLKMNGLNDKQIMPKIDDLMTFIGKFYRKTNDSTIYALEGAKELLDALNGKVLLGLVTGNTEPTAYGKLKYVGFDKYFKFGGFGNEAFERAELLKIAVKKAEKKFNFEFDDNVFHFGDTLRDVEIGKEKGITSIGVATGIYSKKELKKAGADYVFDNLKDTKKILEIINI